jgi:hypothetical protein
MAYDTQLAQRMRDILAPTPHLVEKAMFGGIGFLVRGNMACGVHGRHLIVRVGPASYSGALAEPHVGVFDLTGRPMKGWIVVNPDGVTAAADLERWIARGVEFARTLPAKDG